MRKYPLYFWTWELGGAPTIFSDEGSIFHITNVIGHFSGMFNVGNYNINTFYNSRMDVNIIISMSFKMSVGLSGLQEIHICSTHYASLDSKQTVSTIHQPF